MGQSLDIESGAATGELGEGTPSDQSTDLSPNQPPNQHSLGVVSEWYETHADTIFAYLARRLGREQALDVTADVFRLALERHDRFDPDLGSPLSWLYGIATNLTRRHWRTEQRRLRALDRLAGTDHGGPTGTQSVDGLERPIERIDANRQVQALLTAVEDLAPEDRDLLILVAWEEKTYAEVSQILGIPPGTVASRLHRIRTQLRQLVADHD